MTLRRGIFPGRRSPSCGATLSTRNRCDGRASAIVDHGLLIKCSGIVGAVINRVLW